MNSRRYYDNYYINYNYYYYHNNSYCLVSGDIEYHIKGFLAKIYILIVVVIMMRKNKGEIKKIDQQSLKKKR